MVCSRYYWVCRPGKICNVCFFRLHWFGKCSASTGLNSFSCLSQQGQDLRMNISSARMHSCVAILFQVQCRLFTHAVLFACDTFFVCKIADEFYAANLNVAVAFDDSHKYAVGYSLFCSCFWRFDVCFKCQIYP